MLAALVSAALLALGALVAYRAWGSSRTTTSTPLRGPPREHWLMGQTKTLHQSPRKREVLEAWAAEYGGVFSRPQPFGGFDLVIADPRAAAHILSHSDDIYHLQALTRVATEHLLGRGLIAADGASHSRQKKAIAPGFTSLKIREYTENFYDCAHRLASRLDGELERESGKSTTIDVDRWFSAYSLDTAGLASFGYDMGALTDQPSAVASSFRAIANNTLGAVDILSFVLTSIHPVLALPTRRNRAIATLYADCGTLARTIIRRTRAEETGERSIMGLMVQAEGSSLTEDEITSQIRTLIMAGYETTTATLAWTFIRLCQDQALQRRLRAELVAAFPGVDPTYDDLTTGLPLMDAVVHEVLRLHPPLTEAWRTAQKDDILPLLQPITLSNGTQVDHIVVAKGTTVSLQTEVMNYSRTLWGEDAWEFRPERWLKPLPEGASAIAGYHHLMTFLDGPKACLGRGFAVTNIKTLLAVLMKRFSFELAGDGEAQFVKKFTLVHRPAVDGRKDFVLPMTVRPVKN